MNQYQKLQKNLSEIEGKLQVKFNNQEILAQAFVHRSYANEHLELAEDHNERLEFLGDSVLGLIIAEYLFVSDPSRPEGELSQHRAYLVEATACYEYLKSLNVSEYILLGKGENLETKRGKITIFSDVLEAVIGAIYLDHGYTVTKDFFFHHFTETIQDILKNPNRNYKSDLQDYSQRKFQKVPVYKLVDETGPDHEKKFHVAVFIDDKQEGLGIGFSKKEAEQKAAKDALQKIGKL